MGKLTVFMQIATIMPPVTTVMVHIFTVFMQIAIVRL